MDERRLQFIEGKSSKFWIATHDGTSVTVVFGRIGTSGQTQEKSYGSEAEAKKAFDKLVAEKVKKGYADADGGADATAGGSPAAPAKTDSPMKVAKPKAAAANATLPVEPGPGADGPDSEHEAGGKADSLAARPVPAVLLAKPEPRIRLTQADRIAAMLEPIPVRPRGPVQSFDRAACIERFRTLGKPDTYTYSLRWERLELTPAMSADEAWFWIRLAREGSQIRTAAEAALTLPTTPVDPEEYWQSPPMGLVAAVFAGLGAEAYCKRLFALRYAENEAHGITEWLIPYLDPSEREAFRDVLQAHAAKAAEPWAIWLLAALGLDSQSVATLLTQLTPSQHANVQYYGRYHGDAATLRATFGLRDPGRVLAEVERLGVLPWHAEDVRALFAAVGFPAAALAARAALVVGTKSDAEPLANAMCIAEGPDMVLPMFSLFLESKVPGVARKWLDANAAFVVPELLPLVATQGGKGDAAASYLRELVRAGHDGLVEAALPGLPEHVQRVVQAKVLDQRDQQHAVATDEELPEWASRCFGDPAKLVIAPAQLSPEQEDQPLHLEVGQAWRAAPPAPLPAFVPLAAPAPFDFEACLQRLLAMHQLRGTPQYPYHVWVWPTLRLPMTREEGRFWIEASIWAGHNARPADVEKQLRNCDFAEPIKRERASGSPFLLAAAWAAGGADLLARFAEDDHFIEAFAPSAIEAVVTFLSPGERQTLCRDLLAMEVTSAGGLHLARDLGATDAQLRAALLRLGRNHRFQFAPPMLLRLLYVHEDPETIVREALRVGVQPLHEAEAREWLAATGMLGISTLHDVINTPYMFDRPGLVRVLSAVRAPSIAPIMVSLRRTTAKETARQWLENNIAHTVDGLLPLVGTKDKLASAATDHLRDLCRRGYAWLVEKKSGGRADVAKLVLDPRAGLTKPNAADHALATRLSPMPIKTPAGLRALGPARSATLLAELRSSSLGAPTPRLSLLRENVDEHARDAFAWALFQSWLQDGASSKDRWKMEAVGHLGGDASAIALAKLVRTWPGESQHQRAVLGLECLRAIGSDTALMQIHGISQKVSFKGIKDRAAECIEGIAQDRGMSRDELADRIIPDGGLDERGSRTFDFGPRRFEFLLGDDLKPMVRDEAGKRLPNLPKPNSKDDVALAEEAQATWKLLKKQVAEVVKTQVVRLEHSMVLGRRWSNSDFDALFVRHPLMVHLVRRVIWAAYDAEGTPLSSFRVADDGTLASMTDETFSLPDGAASIGAVHPSHLGADAAQAWGEILADYEIVPPFAQLGRPTYTLTDEERGANLINRFENQRMVAKVLVFGLEAMGWLRGTPQDGGGFCAHRKNYGAVTAIVTYSDGCWAGSNGDDWPVQTLRGVGFVSDTKDADDGFFTWGPRPEGLPLASIDPVILSEVLHDLTRLVYKGREA